MLAVHFMTILEASDSRKIRCVRSPRWRKHGRGNGFKNNPKWIGCEEITDLGLTREALSNYKRGTWINEQQGLHKP